MVVCLNGTRRGIFCDKISTLDDKISGLRGQIDSLLSSSNDRKSAIIKAQSDIDQINSALNDSKSGVNSVKQGGTQHTQGLVDQMKKIEEANAASEKKWQEQQGLIGKLTSQAEAAGKMLANIETTTKNIVTKA